MPRARDYIIFSRLSPGWHASPCQHLGLSRSTCCRRAAHLPLFINGLAAVRPCRLRAGTEVGTSTTEQVSGFRRAVCKLDGQHRGEFGHSTRTVAVMRGPIRWLHCAGDRSGDSSGHPRGLPAYDRVRTRLSFTFRIWPSAISLRRSSRPEGLMCRAVATTRARRADRRLAASSHR